jgi:YD repeat-containing protein
MSRARRRRAGALATAVVGLVLSSAAGAQAANNPGTGDAGFFTFRPSAVAGTQINVASGNALVRTRDLADSDGDYHVVADRAYNSLASDAFSILSPRWGFDVGPATKLVIQNNGDALVTGPSGYRILFAKQADGAFKAPTGFDGSLVASSSGWTLNRTSQGDQFGFNGSGQLSWTKDSQARDFTVQGTSAAGRDVLSSYGTNSGRRVNLSYTGDSLVREMDDPSSGHHYYGYTNGKLTSYRSPSGAESTYRYASNGFLDKITEPGGTTVELIPTAGGKVQSITTTLPGAVGQTTSFVYTRRPFKTDVTGPDQIRRTYAYDDDWRVTRQYNPDVKPTVHAVTDPDTDVTNGLNPLSAEVIAEQSDGAGISSVAVRTSTGSELTSYAVPCNVTPFDRVCPITTVTHLQFSASSLPEGRHQLDARATDDEGNVGVSQPWEIAVDRTAPLSAGDFSTDLGEDDHSLDVMWGNLPDPDLADGSEGSGNASWLFRWRKQGTDAWSRWAPSATSEATIPDADLSATYEVAVVTTDAAGNQSAPAIDTVSYLDFDSWLSGLADLDPASYSFDETLDISDRGQGATAAGQRSTPVQRIPPPDDPIQACAGKRLGNYSLIAMQTSPSPSFQWGYRLTKAAQDTLLSAVPNMKLRFNSDVYVNNASRSQGGPSKLAESPAYLLHGHLTTYSRGSKSKRVHLKKDDIIRIVVSAAGEGYNPATDKTASVASHIDVTCRVIPNRG